RSPQDSGGRAPVPCEKEEDKAVVEVNCGGAFRRLVILDQKGVGFQFDAD
ncbi:MAG: hypothetical protein ACI9NC_004277, partial [Verrucomicrobiales bacterium]